MRGCNVGHACACVVVMLLACGCGGGSDARSAAGSSPTTSKGHVVTLASIIDATRRERTVRFSGTTVLPPDATGRKLTIETSGATDLQTHRTEFTSAQPGRPGHEDTIFDDGPRVYTRILEPDSGRRVGWCSFPAKREPGPGISGENTLATLSGSNRHVQYIGQEVVRGVSTTHYRVTGGSELPIDIWTDAQDRLWRFRWTHGRDKQTDTTDYYDFDAPVTITVPTGAPPCNPYTGTP